LSLPNHAATGTDPGAPPVGGVHASFCVLGGTLLVGLVALLDLATGPYLSFSIFYLAPVAACAWWGGFTPGLLLAVIAALAGHFVEWIESADLPVAAGLWNDVVRLGTLTLTCSLIARLHAGMLRERRLALTDPLTGAANARTFYESAAAEAERARRAEAPLTVAYFDLDHFKHLNDRHGHAAGDEALRLVVRTVRLHLRPTDLLARLGGDEFAVLLPSAGAAETTTILARLRDAVNEQMVARGWLVTTSIGAATFLQPPVDVDLMVRRVDGLMYAAKRGGKARIEHAVVSDAEGPDTGHGQVERRAVARIVCGRAARVFAEGRTEGEFATLHDISVRGIGLRLERRLPTDTLIVIEALSPAIRTLLARVVRVDPDGAGWMHGCTLAHSLDSSALGGWVEATQPESLGAETPAAEEMPAGLPSGSRS
jgi:diguanylate cyclase (GGDEF)-like protein